MSDILRSCSVLRNMQLEERKESYALNGVRKIVKAQMGTRERIINFYSIQGIAPGTEGLLSATGPISLDVSSFTQQHHRY